MKIEYHALDGTSLGTTRHLTVLRFGEQNAEQKIYIQASLHADELPGSLVAYHLRPLLEQLEQEGRIKAHIVLVPLCNPIGLGQTLMYHQSGRFDLFTGRNFNRLTNFPLYERVLAKLKADPSVLSSDGNANVKTIRALMAQEIAAYQSHTQVDLLQSTLVGLAYDADVVLDLHCDEKAVMHTYTLPQLWPQLEPLARYLRSECQILSENSGSNAFDEFLSTIWLRLSREFPQANIPLACFSTTIELRGEGDLQHEWAQTDAQAIVQYLAHIGAIKLDEQAIQAMPDLIREPNPLSGLSYVLAPLAGIAVYRVHPGDTVTQGQVVADIIDPIHQICTPVTTPTDGFVYAVHHANFAQQGTTLVSVSGAKDLGLGDALGP